jgi:AraC-like DNA-binding protein
MKFEHYYPSDLLKPFIKAFLIIESDDGMVNRILPDTSIVLAFQFRGRVMYTVDEVATRLPISVVTGLRKSTCLMHYASQTATLLVLFREGGAAAFFKEPLHALFNSSIPLDNLIHRHKVAAMEDQLAAAATHTQRITLIENFLLSECKGLPSDPLILHAIQQIKATSGTIRIKDLLMALPISQDPFEKRFRRVTGTSPKQFAGIIRLRSLISQHSKAESLTEAAHLAGYFDQAHFIKDFRSFTGQTPKDFFKATSYW